MWSQYICIAVMIDIIQVSVCVGGGESCDHNTMPYSISYSSSDGAMVKDLLQAIQSLASSSGTQPWTTVQAIC